MGCLGPAARRCHRGHAPRAWRNRPGACVPHHAARGAGWQHRRRTRTRLHAVGPLHPAHQLLLPVAVRTVHGEQAVRLGGAAQLPGHFVRGNRTADAGAPAGRRSGGTRQRSRGSLPPGSRIAAVRYCRGDAQRDRRSGSPCDGCGRVLHCPARAVDAILQCRARRASRHGHTYAGEGGDIPHPLDRPSRDSVGNTRAHRAPECGYQHVRNGGDQHVPHGATTARRGTHHRRAHRARRKSAGARCPAQATPGRHGLLCRARHRAHATHGGGRTGGDVAGSTTRQGPDLCVRLARPADAAHHDQGAGAERRGAR